MFYYLKLLLIQNWNAPQVRTPGVLSAQGLLRCMQALLLLQGPGSPALHLTRTLRKRVGAAARRAMPGAPLLPALAHRPVVPDTN